jgi:hypothetical protein
MRFAHVLSRALRWRIVWRIIAVLWGVYLVVLDPWLMNWGATPAEVGMVLPGDDPALGPDAYFTRAMTVVEAPPSVVWPWIVQMGQDRAGFYSNSWLENLTGADIHNADSIHPEWQHPSNRRQRAVGPTGSPLRSGTVDVTASGEGS